MKFLILILLFITTSVSAIDPMQDYVVTNLTSSEDLNRIFENLNTQYKKLKITQCYDRAHFWAYQMYRDDNIFSQKVFIYFTNKYKREIHGAWWFHVAPGVNLNSELYVLDPEFLKSAVPFEAWKNGAIDHAIKKLTRIKINYENEIEKLLNEESKLNQETRYGKNRKAFIDRRITWLNSELERMLIKNARIIPANNQNWPFQDNRKELIEIECPVVTNYSEYKKAQESAYCYIQHSNMFVWEPGELEKLEYLNENKTSFINNEVFTAFKKTFRGSFPYIFEITANLFNKIFSINIDDEKN